jgi:hypothetical protein
LPLAIAVAAPNTDSFLIPVDFSKKPLNSFEIFCFENKAVCFSLISLLLFSF